MLHDLTALRILSLVLLAGTVLWSTGCSQNDEEKASLKRPETDKIGEFDRAAGKQVVVPDVKMTNPVTGPLEAYDPLVQQIATLGIEHAVNLFHAEEGRYPNSYDEFMTRVIQQNQIRLPGLKQGLEYQYDVENHQLRIIRTSVEDAESK